MHIFIITLSLVTLFFGLWMLIWSLLNKRMFKKTNDISSFTSTDDELISVVIPARDEEKNLPRLLSSILDEDYKNIEILVINDQSSDRTEEIIKEFEQKDSRVKGYNTAEGVKLSKHGKINALMQVVDYAKGDYIIFTDADTWQEKNAISSMLKIIKKEHSDILSGFPREHIPSFWAHVITSAMVFSNAVLPQPIIRALSSPRFSLAIGQFIMVKRSSFLAVGGFKAVPFQICDDVALVKHFLKCGKKYTYTKVSDYISCEMYDSARDAYNGLERSITGVFKANVGTFIALLFAVSALLLIFFAPLFSPLFIAFKEYMYLSIYIIGWLLCNIAWYIAARDVKIKKSVASCGFLSVGFICIMYLDGIMRRITKKGFIWKGRKIL